MPARCPPGAQGLAPCPASQSGLGGCCWPTRGGAEWGFLENRPDASALITGETTTIPANPPLLIGVNTVG